MFKLCRGILIAFVVVAVYCVALLFAMGGGLLLLLVLCGLVMLARRRRIALTAFGTARWAGEREIRRAGMASGRGLIVGTLYETAERPSFIAAALGLINPGISSSEACNAFLRSVFPRMKGNPPLVRLSRSVHTAVFAPTGVGKGVSCVIPFLLDCPESCVVVDFKGELAKATMERRRRMGHRIVLIDPFNVVTKKPDTLNQLDFISKDSPFAIDEIRDLAESLVIRTGQEKEPHWLDSAEAWITAATAAVVEYGDADDRSLQTVRDLLSDSTKMETVIKLLCESKAWEGMLSRYGSQLTHFKDKELGSTLTTVNRFLRHLDTVAVAASTKASSFDPGQLLAGKIDVFLILPPEHARVQSPLLRSWISSMLRAVVRGGLQERNRVHFVLDEASSLGNLQQLDDAVDKYRGYGVRLIFMYQSLGQLKKCFPEGQEQTLLSNVTQVFFGVNDQQTADYVSARLGEATIVVKSGGTSRSGSQQYGSGSAQGSYSTSWNTNDNWQQQARKLLKPEEVMALSPRTAITFAPGVPPICTQLTRYYEGRPDSFLRQQARGFRACYAGLILLAGTVVAAKSVEANYQYRLEHPPRVRAVPDRRFR